MDEITGCEIIPMAGRGISTNPIGTELGNTNILCTRLLDIR